jgi:Concanavalin A-like lectin/glucanases superfamily
MKHVSWKIALAALLFGVSTSQLSAGTLVRRWTFGEDDPGAVAGGTVTTTNNIAPQNIDPLTSANNFGPYELTADTFPEDPGAPKYSNDSRFATGGTTARSIQFDGKSLLLQDAVQPYTFDDTPKGDAGFGHIMAMWIKPTRQYDGVNDLRETVMKVGGGEMKLYIDNGRWRAGDMLSPVDQLQQNGDPADPTGLNAVQYNQWTHVAFLHGGSNIRFFINGTQTQGVLDNYGAWGGLTGVGGDPNQGDPVSAEYFTGLIDDARIYASDNNNVLTPFVRLTTIGFWDYWNQADTDLDGDTDAADLTNLRTNFGYVAPSTAVPPGYTVAGPQSGGGSADSRTKGDADINGSVNNLDVAAFITAGLTKNGDADLSGAIGGGDVTAIITNFGLTGQGAASWTKGDFNNDGAIDNADVDLFDAQYSAPEGDTNADGAVDNDDINNFVSMLIGDIQFTVADVDNNNVLDNEDIAPFVTLLLGGSASAVPEPASVTLLVLGAASALVLRRRK